MIREDTRRTINKIAPADALRLLFDSVQTKTVPSEFIAIQDSLGRILAQDIDVTCNIPEYERSFIDGYAVYDKDTKDATVKVPVRLRIVNELFPADYSTDAEIAPGETIYVATGAPIPKGANAAIKVEETILHNGIVEMRRPAEIGEGIIPIGDDVKKGTVVLKKRQVLRPQDIGFLASLGMTRVEVVRKPRIAIISGGDELIRQSKENPEKIVNNYALVIAGLASEFGGAPDLYGIAPDRLEAVEEMISSALEDSDIVVTIGGCSMGKKDFVPDAVNALGKPGVVFQGVLIRPGSVSGFGIVREKPVVILPGHIASSVAGFLLFVVPLIGIYCGSGRESLLPSLKTKLEKDYETKSHYSFALLNVKQRDNDFFASPVEGGSSSLTTVIKANGYAIVAPNTKLRKGDELKTFLFSKSELDQILHSPGDS